MTAGIKILDWRPLKKNSLLGFAKVELPSGMVISDVTILTSERGPWASPGEQADARPRWRGDEGRQGQVAVQPDH